MDRNGSSVEEAIASGSQLKDRPDSQHLSSFSASQKDIKTHNVTYEVIQNFNSHRCHEGKSQAQFALIRRGNISGSERLGEISARRRSRMLMFFTGTRLRSSWPAATTSTGRADAEMPLYSAICKNQGELNLNRWNKWSTAILIHFVVFRQSLSRD
jgi:hypothetical protein